MNQCPECGNLLSANKTGCSCGWFAPEIKTKKSKLNGQCEYQSAENRCPLPGTVFSSPYSKGPGYCSDHVRELGNHHKCEEILRYNLEHYNEIMEKRRSWKDKLFEKNES